MRPLELGLLRDDGSRSPAFQAFKELGGTFIVAIAIPTSILATFLPMYAFGFTLNGMTMMNLTYTVQNVINPGSPLPSSSKRMVASL